MANKVVVGRRYRYVPVMLDKMDWDIPEGTIVRVVNQHGCPPANTMGHCYIETLEGKFIGLVCTNSLVPIERKVLKD